MSERNCPDCEPGGGINDLEPGYVCPKHQPHPAPASPTMLAGTTALAEQHLDKRLEDMVVSGVGFARIAPKDIYKPTASEPRVWWAYPNQDSHDGLPFSFSEILLPSPPYISASFTVIEHAAYERLERECAEHVNANRVQIGKRTLLEAELAEAKATRDKWEQAAVRAFDDRDRLSLECDEALARLRKFKGEE